MKLRRAQLLLLHLVAGIALICIASSPTYAQEREERRQFLGAMLQLEEEFQNSAGWRAWRDEGGFLALTREIEAGKLAQPAAVRDSTNKLLRGLGSQSATVTRVNAAVSRWLETLEGAADSEQPDVLAAAQSEVSAGGASLDLFHKDLQGQFDRLARSLQGDAQANVRWRDFLLWESSLQLVAQKPLSNETLEALETRWTLAQRNWNTFRFRYTAQSIMRAIILSRRAAIGDSTAIAEAIQNVPSCETTSMSSEASHDEKTPALSPAGRVALQQLDRLDLGAAISLPWHRNYDQPHGQLRVRSAAMLPHFRQPIDETFRIQDRFAGTPVRGTGRIQGEISIEPLDRVIPAWNMVFKGSSTSSTVGSNSGVTVNSSASANIQGSKVIEWRTTGLVTGPASASAQATVSFGGISTGGSQRRRSTAQGEVYASRAAAERDTELAIRRSTIERLDSHTRHLLQPLNEKYQATFVRPINDQELFAPRVTTRPLNDAVAWDCWYVPVEGLALSTPPASNKEDSDWSLALHELFLARHLTTMLGQRDVKVSELGRMLGATPGANPGDSALENSTDHAATPVLRLRTSDPVEVRIAEQAMQFTFHLDEYRSPQGNVTVPTTIELTFQCSLNEGGVLLRRSAAPAVRIDQDGSGTGRSQTLKRILMRHLARVIPETTMLQIEVSPRAGQASSLQTTVSDCTLEDGWLQMAGGFKAS